MEWTLATPIMPATHEVDSTKWANKLNLVSISLILAYFSSLISCCDNLRATVPTRRKAKRIAKSW